MTVSRVLRGKDHGFSDETRQRVLQAAAAMNYVPVRATVQNRHSETHILSIVFDGLDPVQGFYGPMIYQGMYQGAREVDYDLLTLVRAQPDWASGRDEIRFLDRRSDGFIFVNPTGRDAIFKTLLANEIPIVCCGRPLQLPAGVACVSPDNQTAMTLAVEHLTEHGHRSIGFLSWSDVHGDQAQRALFYRQAMTRAGLETYEIGMSAAGSDEAGPWPHVMSHIESADLTAVICASDGLALHLRDAALARDWTLPKDLSLVGMDGTPEGEMHGLTTIDFSFGAMGTQSVQALVRLLQGGPVRGETDDIPVRLLERSSVTSPGQR